jgi:hypothetical protein
MQYFTKKDTVSKKVGAGFSLLLKISDIIFI